MLYVKLFLRAYILVAVIFIFEVPWLQASVFSGAEGICSLQECDCQGDRVECICQDESSFQESFVFFADSRKLQHLKVENCPKLTLPEGSISPESHLLSFEIRNVKHVEFHADAISISRLRELLVSDSAIVTFHQHSFKASMVDTPSVSVFVENAQKLIVKPKAFASIKSFTAVDVDDLTLEHNAFKLRVPTEEPTINLKFVNISTPSLSSSVFPSSFKSITIENSKVDKVHANAFSGLYMNNITFDGVSINRIERGAFSDNTIIGSLKLNRCNISSLSQKSVVAGVSKFILTNSVIQSISKHGAINATVATVEIVNNRFRTLGQESFQFVSWDSVIIDNNTFEFLEQGSLNAIKGPSEDQDAYFSFTNNFIGYANFKSLVTQIPTSVNFKVNSNSFGHTCDCKMETYVKSITGHTSLSSPFQDLTNMIQNTSQCRISDQEKPCFRSLSSLLIGEYTKVLCNLGQELPACARIIEEEDEEVEDLESSEEVDRVPVEQNNNTVTFYDEFIMLFQVKTTKGILLFLLFCVLSSVITVTICVGSIWVHRLCKRAKLVRDNLSGSFQFNSGDDKQILYGSDQTTCHSLPDDEPQYAEIAEIHPHPKDIENQTLSKFENFTLPKFESTTLISNAASTLPSIQASTLPMRSEMTDTNQTESTSLLSENLETTQISRLSMSETSLTDEIMMALRDKLNDPNLYMSVMDAKLSPSDPSKKEEDLYCAPLYSDPLQLSPAP